MNVSSNECHRALVQQTFMNVDSNIGLLVILVDSVYLIASSFLIMLVALSYNGLLFALTVSIAILFLAFQYQELALTNCLLSA